MVQFSEYTGLLRSLVVYYGHPLRHFRLKRLYGEFVRPGDLVFDVGAHVGNHTRAFLSLEARVVAVEPQPLFASFLGRIFKRVPQIAVLDAALGAGPGRAEMKISRRTPTVSTLDGDWHRRVGETPTFKDVRWDRRIEVDVSTLDAVIAAHGRPVLIKLDVEGSEAEVLSGLSEPVPAVCFEALPPIKEPALECVDRLVELGFDRFNWTVGERAALRPVWAGPDSVRRMLAGLPPESREHNIFALCDGV